MNDRTSRRALLFGRTYLWLLGADGRWSLRRVDYGWDLPTDPDRGRPPQVGTNEVADTRGPATEANELHQGGLAGEFPNS